MRYKAPNPVQDGDAMLESIMQPNCCYHYQDIATIFEPCQQTKSAQTTTPILRDHYAAE